MVGINLPFMNIDMFNNIIILMSGLSKVMHDIFGEEGQALANNATISKLVL